MLKLITTQKKVLPTDTDFLEYEINSASTLRNEPFSFQLVYKAESEIRQPVTLDIDSPLPVKEWRIDFVPVSYAANDYNERGYVSDAPGLYPDLLEERPARPEIIRKGGLHYEKGVKYLLNASDRVVQTVLVTVNPDSAEMAPGVYEINCTLRALSDLSVIGKASLRLEVIGASLPEQTEKYTNWFHVDSLCDFYNVEPYSDEFYRYFISFIKNASAHRMNTLLLPAFTPALDTPIGHARRNVQLVGIERNGSGWSFDFTELSKFMKIASDNGIRYFEHCHLFSQWGAAHAPCIYDKTGNLLFGWDTDAAGEEYRSFIRSYLESFIAFVRSEGYSDDRIIFHISDEPTEKQLEGYRKAHDTIADLIDGFDQIDALSDVSFSKTGLVKTPVAFIAKADEFDGECDNFWLYYTCGTYAKNCSNRLVTNTPARTRILGAQMFRYRATGFLQWGYNFYYDRMSEGWFDPRVNPDGYKLLPGCSYLCYPEKDGATPSLREVHMAEAFDDLRALRLLESHIGRERTLEVCENHLGKLDNHTIPEGNAMFGLREEINRRIKECTE